MRLIFVFLLVFNFFTSIYASAWEQANERCHEIRGDTYHAVWYNDFTIENYSQCSARYMDNSVFVEACHTYARDYRIPDDWVTDKSSGIYRTITIHHVYRVLDIEYWI